MNAHPTVWELHAFIREGMTSFEFEQHVSTCARCARALQKLAVRAAPLVLPTRMATATRSAERSLQWFSMALMACVAVLMVRSVSMVSLPATAVYPEGLHGIAVAQDSPATAFTGSDDGGPMDSGSR